MARRNEQDMTKYQVIPAQYNASLALQQVMSPAKHAVVKHGEPTCCLAHGSASAFICAEHAMLYLMGRAVATTTSAVTSCRCAECCC